jgi:hypothetical protein
MFRIKFIFKLGYKKSNQPTQEASLEGKKKNFLYLFNLFKLLDIEFLIFCNIIL